MIIKYQELECLRKKAEEINWDFYRELLKKYKLEDFKDKLAALLKETKQAPELDLNEYLMAKLRNEILAILK